MYLIGKITVTNILPEELSRLKDIAYNLWWSWNSEAIDLFREIDPALWEKIHKNPVRFIQEVSQKKLEEKINDQAFMEKYRQVVERYDAYISDTNTWFDRNHPDKKQFTVAYFSAEYGLNEVLPIYSGGLGILSGDHCKSASDLGIPLVAIGLFYKQGYFDQHINLEGWQETSYPHLNVSHLPLLPVIDEAGNQVHISVELPGRVVYAKIWQVKIGRVVLYLMDTDIEENSEADRMITARLYGGDQETRIQQEIFLGIGGIRLLEKLGFKNVVYHMNEGHSAFMGLEVIKKLVQEQRFPFHVAREAASSAIIFTTHTPVPAGNDVFPLHMIDKYFSNYWGLLNISRHEFLDLGLKVNDSQNFNMTVLALALAGWKNGVSELHGSVTRSIFNNLWPGVPEDEVPITHITNGIHTLTWLPPEFKRLYVKYLESDWKDRIHDKKVWEKIDTIPDEELWRIHCALKNKMIHFIRERLKQQRLLNGEPMERVNEAETLLDPNALTIGFARRFATYKRANLIFRNIERIRRIINNPKMPVQIIFAGKAHPADRPAHEIIKNIYGIAEQEGFTGKVILVENYNMTLARYMIQGADVWMNNPRRPLEASGTSGQKVAINGVINMSVLDGWWCEGYNGENGWVIGNDAFYTDEYQQDNTDSESIYELLENQVIPLYYERDERGVPVRWVKLMKESIKSLAYRYNTHRMLQEYMSNMYIPSMERLNAILLTNYELARQLSEWKLNIEKNWPEVRITAEKSMSELKEMKSVSGKPLTVSVQVYLGNISPSDIKVEVYYGTINKNKRSIENPRIKSLETVESIGHGTYRFSGDITILDGGEYGYTFRAVPHHKDLIHKFDMGLVKWVVE